MSLMGIYGPDMIVGSGFPTVLRIALITRIYLPIAGFEGETLRVLTMFPGMKEPAGEVAMIIPGALPPNFSQERPEDHEPGSPRYMMFGLNFGIPNVEIERPGFVRVRGYIKDHVIRCGALHVRPPQTPEEMKVFEELNPKA